MIIEENQLRPPSPKEMAARHVPLEHVTIQWVPSCWESETLAMPGCIVDCQHPETCGTAEVIDAGFTTLELIEFHKQWAIPYEAFLVNDGYEGEKALDWTHLSFCEICTQWFLPETQHTATDTLHLAKVREMMKLITGEETS